jgi:hypothetical protein
MHELPVQRFTQRAKTIGRILHLQVDFQGRNFKSSVDYQGPNFITQDIAALIKDASM